MKRLPIGLTLATLIGLAILLALGGWQMKRLAWKTDLLARIEKLKTAPARPLADVLALAAKGENVDFSRVTVVCDPTGLKPSKVWLFGLKDGQAGWRSLAPCGLPGQVIIIDRGFSARGEDTTPPTTTEPPPQAVTGILRRPDTLTGVQHAVTQDQNDVIGWQTREGAMASAMRGALSGGAKASPFILVAESESPQPFGLNPAPLPTDIPNRHLEYALTWFGLAATLIAIYGAMLWRRFKTP
jgi:surfeit locus 1 family protein